MAKTWPGLPDGVVHIDASPEQNLRELAKAKKCEISDLMVCTLDRDRHKELIAKDKPDLVLMPIGGNFTMDPDDAAFAAKTWINPKAVIPMHYNSNPLAKGTLAEFTAAMRGSAIRVVPMSEGQTVEF